MLLAPPAPNNATTLDSIRQMVRQGRTVAAMAEALGWSVDVLMRWAREHSIVLTLGGDSVAKAPGAGAKKKNERAAAPVRPKVDGRFRHRGAHPRNEYLSIAVSLAAIHAAEKIGARIGKTRTGIVGLIIDYIARSGKLETLFEEALAERAEMATTPTPSCPTDDRINSRSRYGES